MSQSDISSLARTFAKVYSEMQEVRLASCYCSPSAGGAPSAPVDLSWWLCSYNNALTRSDLGIDVADQVPEAASFTPLLNLWALAARLIPLIGDGSIQTSSNPAELYLEWARHVTSVESLFELTMTSLNDPALRLEAVDITSALTVVFQLVAGHRFSNAANLLNIILAHIRKDTTIDAGCERSISRIINLLINDFSSPVQFESWQAKAKEYLKDARFELQAQAQEAATVSLLKKELLDLLFALSGDAMTAGKIVGQVPVMHFAAICAFIDPFMKYDALGKQAAKVFSTVKEPLMAAAGDLLTCATLADVCSVMVDLSDNAEKSTTMAPANSILALMAAAHIADVASPPFAASPAAMPLVVSVNGVVERYVINLHRVLREEEEGSTNKAFTGVVGSPSAAYRLCGLYLAWRPFSNPSVSKAIFNTQLDIANQILAATSGNEVSEEKMADGSVANEIDDVRVDSYVAALDDLAQHINSLFNMGSVLQMRLRPLVSDLTRNAPATASLFQWWDIFVSQFLTQIRDKIFGALVKGHRFSELLVRSVEANHYVELKRALCSAIEGPDALTHPAVLQCGECISTGLVDVAVLAQQLQAQTQHQHNHSTNGQQLALLNSSNLGGTTMNASTTIALNNSATLTPSGSASIFGPATTPLSEAIALLHIASCLWDMTMGADQIAAIEDAGMLTSGSSSIYMGSEGNSTASIAAGTERLADANGFERLDDSVRFTLLQRLTNLVKGLRASKSPAAAGAHAFGSDGRGVARAKNFQLLLVDLATSIDESKLAWESAASDLEGVMVSLVSMGTCWC